MPSASAYVPMADGSGRVLEVAIPVGRLALALHNELRYICGMATINEQRFLILTALASGPRHGYGLSDEIAELTDGESRPRAGALYHALDRLADDGLVAVDREDVVDGRLRRYYALTAPGRVVLEAEATKRQRAAQHAFNRLGGLA